MATTEEIERRVDEADSARRAKRSAAAKQVGELAQRRAAVAEQLDEIERELGEVLAAASDVIDVDELARFTDVPAEDLSRWLASRKPSRTKRKRSTAGVSGAKGDTSRGPSTASAPTARPVPTLQEPAAARNGVSDARVPAPVT